MFLVLFFDLNVKTWATITKLTLLRLFLLLFNYLKNMRLFINLLENTIIWNVKFHSNSSQRLLIGFHTTFYSPNVGMKTLFVNYKSILISYLWNKYFGRYLIAPSVVWHDFIYFYNRWHNSWHQASFKIALYSRGYKFKIGMNTKSLTSK